MKTRWLILGFLGAFFIGIAAGISLIIFGCHVYIDVPILGRISVPIHKLIDASWLGFMLFLLVLGTALLLLTVERILSFLTHLIITSSKLMTNMDCEQQEPPAAAQQAIIHNI